MGKALIVKQDFSKTSVEEISYSRKGIDFNDLFLESGYVDPDTKKWAGTYQNAHISMGVKGYSKAVIDASSINLKYQSMVANAATTYCMVAFFEGRPIFESGLSARGLIGSIINISVGNVSEVTIPANASYMYIYVGYFNYYDTAPFRQSYLPKSIFLTR